MPFKEIHHVTINASNYQVTKNLYVEELGFEALRESHRSEKNDTKLDLKLGSQELEIFISDQFPACPSYSEAPGLCHLVSKVECIEEVIAFLNEQGAGTESLRVDDFTGREMILFFDPDGPPLELYE